MSIATLQCPGYAEGHDGRTVELQADSPEPVLLQEIGTSISVRCHALIDGTCAARFGKVCNEEEFAKETGEKGKQLPCYWLSK